MTSDRTLEQVVHRVPSSLLGPVAPSVRDLSERLKTRLATLPTRLVRMMDLLEIELVMVSRVAK